MVKSTQTIRREKPMNCLSLFEHFMGLTLKGLVTLALPFFNGLKVSFKQLIEDKQKKISFSLSRSHVSVSQATFKDASLL